jgi:8-oxo-dGTP pyrophosphatase MutT (NUDIX family)
MTETAGIFFINKNGKLLVAHPTGHDFDFWSIPKGKLDEGETPWIAAKRETWEETNVNLSKVTKYYDFDSIGYKNKRKRLNPFVVFEDENPEVNSDDFLFRCNSTVPAGRKWNGGKPEMDGWRWVTLKEAKEILHDTQIEVLKQIKKHIKEKNG